MSKAALNKIKELLGMEVKLEEMKTESGVVVYADEFAPGNALYVIGEDGERMKAPEGEIPLEGGQSLVVDSEGMIVSIGEAEQVEPEPEQEMKEETPAKKVVETTSKETHFDKEETVEVFFNDVAKAELKQMFEAWYNEKLSATEEKEEVEETKEELSKVQPIKHSPEKKKKSRFNFSTNGRTKTQRITEYLNNR